MLLWIKTQKDSIQDLGHELYNREQGGSFLSSYWANLWGFTFSQLYEINTLSPPLKSLKFCTSVQKLLFQP